MPPALGGGFFTTEPPGKPHMFSFLRNDQPCFPEGLYHFAFTLAMSDQFPVSSLAFDVVTIFLGIPIAVLSHCGFNLHLSNELSLEKPVGRSGSNS